MKRAAIRCTAALGLALVTAAAGYALPPPPPASLVTTAWAWLAARLHPTPPGRPAVRPKEGSDMDPNGHKLNGAVLATPPLDDAGSDMDPDGRQ